MESNILKTRLEGIVKTIRAHHVEGGEFYDASNPIDAKYLADLLERLITE